MRARAWIAAACASLVSLVAACGPDGAAPENASAPTGPETGPTAHGVPQGSRYVALGDSYTAAPGTGRPVGTPPGCGRSGNNYPRLVADALDVETLVDVSCGGATTGDLVSAQRTSEGTNPPQVEALTRATSLVTVGIGGNDVGFVELASRCAGDQARSPCRSGSGGLGARVTRATDDVAETLDEIRERAPRARVVVVGYPAILPEDTGACGELPYEPAEIEHLRRGLDRLDAGLRETARRAGAEFADTAAGT
ncbi:SGNH/GDSL hydrolase family protein, partial [Saccharomonospora saliphila]|uniref:SGNH/GDSL hydrolase family protein n=1 Tax=Saccharomonospora saliphila TaxID=369829 RepID=UPI00037BB29B